ncbi:MAG: BTAD domain-containing putative transcriptional regulator [Chloroflexota bacterium]|nr:BTAD domain-containing putative transcriptional regulator [Chloroflexota bacterium]
MTELRIQLLGSFAVLRDGEPIPPSAWRNQQTRTVLKVLLARRGRIVASDQLLEILWPHDNPDTARRRLHVRISQLRRALDPDKPAAFILTVAGGYTFNPEAGCWIDALEFEARAQWGRRCQESGSLAEAVTAYETAHALYRGDFLTEDLYEDWTCAERERLRECFLTMLTELAECYAQQGRYRRAIARCRQVLTSDPYREAVYVRLMLYHYYAGEQSQALRTYERCCQVLTAELDVEPLPATVTLAEQIRDGTLGTVADAPRYPPPAYEGRLFEVPYSLGQVPFVGRAREYAWLVEQWRKAQASVILIEGEAGVGKSRLVDEFLGYAEAEGAIVLRSRATADGGLPYAPVVAALRPLLEPGRVTVGDRPQLDIPTTTLAALAPLFPEVRDRYPDLPALPELPAPQERDRLFAAVEVLVQARAPARTLLHVDNAHRAGAASLDLLIRLADTLTVVLTCRSEETPPDHPLRAALQPLRREGRLAELTLEPLATVAVQKLIRRLAHADPLTLSAAVLSQTGGNPLFVIASLQHIFEEGAFYVDAEGHWATAGDATPSLPPTMRETIEARLRRLSGDLRRVFDLAAVIGGEFDFALLQHASRVQEAPLLDALDGLLEAGLLVEPRTQGRAEFALAHDCYAEVAYDTLPLVRRRRLHRRVAEALETTAPDLDVAAPTLAHHFEQAGDAPCAFDWLIRAGDAARARYAHTEALTFYQRAVDLEAGEPAPTWLRMGQAAHHLARYADGARYYEKALARWQTLGNTAEQMRAHCSLAECHRELSQFDQAADHARAGLEMALAAPEQLALAARGHIVLANALRSGQLAPAEVFRKHLEQALALARSAEAWNLVGEATFWLGVVTINAGDAAGALVYDREALACFRRTGQTGWEAISLNNLAYHSLLAGQADLALETAEEGLALARRIESHTAQGWLLSTLGEVQTHLGLLETARATLEEGLALVTRWGPCRLRPGFLADLARVASAQREWEPALSHLEEAFTLAVETAPQFVPRLRVALAETHLGRGNLARAESEARQAQETAQQKGQRSVEGQAWRVLGTIHAAAGRPTEAETAFTRSLELLVRNELESARTRYAWGRWLKQRGDPRANELLETARQTFERCRAVLDLKLLASRPWHGQETGHS